MLFLVSKTLYICVIFGVLLYANGCKQFGLNMNECFDWIWMQVIRIWIKATRMWIIWMKWVMNVNEHESQWIMKVNYECEWDERKLFGLGMWMKSDLESKLVIFSYNFQK